LRLPFSCKQAKNTAPEAFMPFTGAVAIINYKYIASANLRWKLGALANSM
jgi:hypothetical protein